MLPNRVDKMGGSTILVKTEVIKSKEERQKFILGLLEELCLCFIHIINFLKSSERTFRLILRIKFNITQSSRIHPKYLIHYLDTLNASQRHLSLQHIHIHS